MEHALYLLLQKMFIKSGMSNSSYIGKEQTYLHLLASGEHKFSDEVNGCRFSTHMDLLSTQTWSGKKR